MLFSIPIYVEQRSPGGTTPTTFTARPLFASGPVQRAEKLGRALSKLGQDLHGLLRNLGDESRHDELADWIFNPPLEEATLELRLDLTSGAHRRTFFFAGFTTLGRKVWLTPSLPGLRFEVLPGQSLIERATLVLTRHLREIERLGPVDLDDLALNGRARLTVLEIELHIDARRRKAAKSTLALIVGSDEPKDGESELRRTGRALDSLFPDDLGHAVGREREVEELARLFAGSDRRPVVLVGPRSVGKTAIVHDLVRRICAGRKVRYAGGREVWHLSPMRLVSGMSVLGEWEDRVLAILDHARKRDRVLYFDDLPGLFTAGISNASDLNVAQVLRPVLERRSVRVIAEITPEAWRVLRERDRAFADLFHVIPVKEPPEVEILRVLIHVARRLEEEHRCEFDLETVPTVYELLRRHAGDAAFPGKAAGFLGRLGVRYAGQSIGREMALEEFQEQSGMRVAVLDERRTLARPEILAALGRRVVGQVQVLHSFADVLVKLKARLNDSKRPLGAMLLLGPTGVGKTQSARALAEYLFGAADRLLRFDMNEYVDAFSVPRLTGTVHEPEGLLTGAIRRQPFSVLLFDEIEKAAPEVFDLLLAVLDEGRLTDSLGRVADFTQTVILLTSNLGVQEARSRLGFGSATSGADDDDLYVGAAEKFFRPEFFNRLDRIVPFRSLPPPDLETIANQLLADLFARDGLQRRRGAVEVSPAALGRLVELGHHPQWGARALKRVVEREVAQPLAVRLAEMPPGQPMIARLDFRDGRFELHLRGIRPVARTVVWPALAAQACAAPGRSAWMNDLLRATEAALRRIGRDLDAIAPSGAIDVTALSVEQSRYFHCREQWRRVERLRAGAEESESRPKGGSRVARVPSSPGLKVVARRHGAGNPGLSRQRQAETLQNALADLDAEPISVPDLPSTGMLAELALLEAVTARPLDDRPLLLVFRSDAGCAHGAVAETARAYYASLALLWGVAVAPLGESEVANPDHPSPNCSWGTGRLRAFCVHGLNLRRLVPEGTHPIMVQLVGGEVALLHLIVETVEGEAEARARVTRMARDPGPSAGDGDDVVMVIHKVTPGATTFLTDYRTGVAVAADGDLRGMLLSGLPLPDEVMALFESRDGERIAPPTAEHPA